MSTLPFSSPKYAILAIPQNKPTSRTPVSSLISWPSLLGSAMGPKCASMTKLPLSVTTGPAFCTAYRMEKSAKMLPRENKSISFTFDTLPCAIWQTVVWRRVDCSMHARRPCKPKVQPLWEHPWPIQYPKLWISFGNLDLTMLAVHIISLIWKCRCSLPAIMTNFFAALATTISWNWQAPPPFQTKKEYKKRLNFYVESLFKCYLDGVELRINLVGTVYCHVNIWKPACVLTSNSLNSNVKVYILFYAS